jgi:flagellar biogenesis protein FliO
VDGPTADNAGPAALRRVTPVSGDATRSVRDPRRPAVTVSTIGGDAGIQSPPEEPLARLNWPAASEQIDPAQTLREWAEGAGLLVAFCIVSLWIVRQWLTKRTPTGGPAAHMRTVESLSLPQRCRVHLVDVGGRQVLVTTDAAGVKCVTVLPDRFAALLDDDPLEATAAAAPAADRPEPEQDRWTALRESRLT